MKDSEIGICVENASEVECHSEALLWCASILFESENVVCMFENLRCEWTSKNMKWRAVSESNYRCRWKWRPRVVGRANHGLLKSMKAMLKRQPCTIPNWIAGIFCTKDCSLAGNLENNKTSETKAEKEQMIASKGSIVLHGKYIYWCCLQGGSGVATTESISWGLLNDSERLGWYARVLFPFVVKTGKWILAAWRGGGQLYLSS